MPLVKANLDFENQARIQNLPDPSAAQEPATKAYVDAAIEGVAWKDSVRVRMSSNVNLASPGATLDGITMSTGDRFLAAGQSAGAENGVYVWNGAATPATRSPDCSTAAELEQAITTVEEGTSAGTSWRQTSVNFTLGSGAVAWTQFGAGASAASETTAGIAEIATQAETDTGTDDARFVTPLKLATYANRKLKFSSTFGDGAATQYDITHNLGTLDVQLEVRRVSDDATVICDMRRLTTNSVRLNFAAAPASNSLRVVVIG